MLAKILRFTPAPHLTAAPRDLARVSATSRFIAMRCSAGVLGFAILIGAITLLSAASVPPRESMAHTSSWRDLSLPAQALISGVLGRGDDAYAVLPTPSGLRAENPNHAITAEFSAAGVRINHYDDDWMFKLVSFGYGDAMSEVASAEPRVYANRVEYARGVLTEWYANGPLGLEHGLTFERPPNAERQADLTVRLAMTGNLHAHVTDRGTAIALERADGVTALKYAGLSAQDATGQPLHAWMEIASRYLSDTERPSETLVLHVDDRNAAYPLMIDPFVQKAQLTASDGLADESFGESVAISADGNTIAVGADHKVGSNTAQGEVYVFVKPSGGWSGNLQEQARLTASDGAAYDQFRSVAISADGSTIVVGAYKHKVGSNAGQGEAYVFVKPIGGWSGDRHEDAQLTASNGAASDYFGGSVAISADGSTVVVGATWHQVGSNIYQGEAYVFGQTCIWIWCGWITTTENARLTASNGAAYDQFGVVGISGDGKTVIVGAPVRKIGNNNYQGAAYVFVHATWSGDLTEDARLTSSNGGYNDFFGNSLAINSDGYIIVIGAPYHDVGSNTDQGEVYVFQRLSGWMGDKQEWNYYTASDGLAGDEFGGSVAITGDGNTMVVGAARHKVGSNTNQGVAYVFGCPPLTFCIVWLTSTQIAEFTSSDGGAYDSFGADVAISADARTIGVGAVCHTVGSTTCQGETYVFMNPYMLYLPMISK